MNTATRRQPKEHSSDVKTVESGNASASDNNGKSLILSTKSKFVSTVLVVLM